jgi:hypothetical protein
VAVKLTKGQRRTLAAVGAYSAFQLVGAVGLLGWEFYALSLNDQATISETIWVLYAAQQWPFFLAGVSVVGIVAWLGGHFFAQRATVYDEIRGGRQ